MQNEYGMDVLRANRANNIEELKRLFLETKLVNILDITESEKWNWLHKSLVLASDNMPSKEIIRFYIENGVPINAQDCYGMTPLHYAMRAKNVEVALLLLEAGADPNIPNKDRLIPLSMIGYIPERLDILELMLKNGADIHYFVNEGQTILESYKPRPYDNENIAKIYEMMKSYE